jgi:Arc/MetJ-type ribon-helix-helix transcriptional regulator
MEIRLTPDQEEFIREAVASGRLHSAEEAAEQALSMWEERERSRMEILAAIEMAEFDLKHGYYQDYSEETLTDLAEELKREARTPAGSSNA